MILDALILQSKLFLSEDMDINIKGVEVENSSPDKLVLKDYTSMIGTGGKLNSMIVISFDNLLLDKLVELFMDGEQVEDEEFEEVRDSVSGETINTIIGLALPTFPNRGKGVTITPPITINDASNIKKYKDSKILSANITTDFGTLSISAMGSEDTIK
ncbi:chemotaxis protein CheX [Sulfurospirillum arcachonense]|uniref:chemotaxis protein CheX n=1 Tax=Sulfurospirillum arcachonense TaxID=57666 RepID=UPI00046A0F52|nr:chemotaxis protein CheX [Sulfurospirillum arcachonense]